MHAVYKAPKVLRTGQVKRAEDRTWPEVRVFCGPPGAGKSTMVNNQAQPGELVVEFDRLARALSPVPVGQSDSGHHHGEHAGVKDFIFAAQNALLKRLRFSSDIERAWLTALAPTNKQRARYLIGPDARMTILSVPPEVAHARCAADCRPDLWHSLIDDYYERYEEPTDERVEIRTDY